MKHRFVVRARVLVALCALTAFFPSRAESESAPVIPALPFTKGVNVSS